jgi:peptidoglycan/xylan/chitin deacetylase (PgdA/CDA1 family)
VSVEPMSSRAAEHAVGLRLLAVLAALSTALAILLTPVAARSSAARPLSVTFTFDDGFADELIGQQLLQQYGMRGTFYTNSSFIGLPGYMTRAQLAEVAARGHEIGGHTVSHQPLLTLSADEQNRQICQDRNTLLSWGYAVSSFAYPFAEFNAITKAAVQQCGYNSARAVGDLRSPYSCADCPETETVPPADRFEIRTPDDVESHWTLANMQNLVLRAETTGGWLPFNLHHFCTTGCPAESISPAVFGQFLAWLRPRSSPAIRTTVKTVQQVLGGAVKPAVPPAAAPGPGAPGVNTVRNASLETP